MLRTYCNNISYFYPSNKEDIEQLHDTKKDPLVPLYFMVPLDFGNEHSLKEYAMEVINNIINNSRLSEETPGINSEHADITSLDGRIQSTKTFPDQKFLSRLGLVPGSFEDILQCISMINKRRKTDKYGIVNVFEIKIVAPIDKCVELYCAQK